MKIPVLGIEGIEAEWSIKGFNDRFDQILKDFPTLTRFDAYRKTEEEHEKLFGHDRYKSYDSFRWTRRQLIKGKNTNGGSLPQ